MKKTTAQKKTTKAARPAAKKPAAKPAARSVRAAAPAKKPAAAAKARAVAVPKAADQEVTAPGRKMKPAPTAVVRAAAPAPAAPPKRVPPRIYDKADVERAAKAILKALRPLVAEEEDNDPEAVGRRLSLENAHPRRRADGNYEVFLRYNAGVALGDPEAEAETRARRWFDERSEYPGIPVAVDVNVLEDREA